MTVCVCPGGRQDQPQVERFLGVFSVNASRVKPFGKAAGSLSRALAAFDIEPQCSAACGVCQALPRLRKQPCGIMEGAGTACARESERTTRMRTVLTLSNEQDAPLPEDIAAGPDVRFSPRLVERLLAEFTRPGAVVFDPFAGFGTTLLVAEAMGREGWGIEIEPERAAFVRAQMGCPRRLLTGDSRQMLSAASGSDDLPAAFDFSLTSPPYRGRNDREDPLSGYALPDRGYETYLSELRNIYAGIAERMTPTGKVIIEAANIKQQRERASSRQTVTRLAWDIAGIVADVLDFEGEIVIVWEKPPGSERQEPAYGFGYDHSYCLVFSRH